MQDEVLKKCEILMIMYKKGLLGGEVMPEDENPHLDNASLENFLYFTLPMSLNYQRNSYTLWEGANKTFHDPETKFVFYPDEVVKRSFEEVQTALVKYKVALQKNKQTEIWIKLCQTFINLFAGDIRLLLSNCNNDVNEIRDFIVCHKKDFPYISGTKLVNYWLYVIMQYTNIRYVNPECLTVAPDTHVVKATNRLGLISDEELESSNVQEIVIDRWNKLFMNTPYKPIDIHTPLWLWSRNGFRELDESVLDEK